MANAVTKCPSLEYGFPAPWPFCTDSILASLRTEGGGCGLPGRRGAGGAVATGDGTGLDDFDDPPNNDANRPLRPLPEETAGGGGRGGRGGGCEGIGRAGMCNDP